MLRAHTGGETPKLVQAVVSFSYAVNASKLLSRKNKGPAVLIAKGGKLPKCVTEYQKETLDTSMTPEISDKIA